MGIFSNLGLLFVGWWPLLLPINWLIVAWEYYYARRRRRTPFRAGRLEALIIAQLFSPCLFFILYAVLPLSTQEGSFFRISEKAVIAAGITGAICAAVTFFSFCSVIQFGEKK